MKRNLTRNTQNGAVLLVALVMLLVITVLAIGSMRGVTLETRITSNRAHAHKMIELADAATREAEFRFFGPAHLRSKLEFESSNCRLDNKLKSSGMNKPCLMQVITDKNQLMDFVKDPLGFFAKHTDYSNIYAVITGNEVAANKVLAWMPYRGLDALEGNYYVAENDYSKSYWNAYLINSGAEESEEFNSEYGAVGEGRGTFYYLVNGQVNDEIAVQSTIANIYLGLNN